MFVAKIPTSYPVWYAMNATGDGRTVTWLTSNSSTGAYATYAYQLQCGSTGSFSTFGHVYIQSGTKPVTWYLAYSHVWDITNGKSVTYNVGTGNGRLTAEWVPNTYTLTFDPNTGTCATTTKSVTYGQSYTDLPKATKTGYKFMGWFAQCANTAGTAVNMGRNYKYTSALSVHFVTYSTDYSA